MWQNGGLRTKCPPESRPKNEVFPLLQLEIHWAARVQGGLLRGGFVVPLVSEETPIEIFVEWCSVPARSLIYRRYKVDNYIPHKINVEITDEQSEALNRLLPHGTRKPIFGVLVDDLIEMMEKHGTIILGALLHRALKLEDFIKLPHDVRGLLHLDKEEKNSGHHKPKAKSTRSRKGGRTKSNSGSEKTKEAETPAGDQGKKEEG